MVNLEGGIPMTYPDGYLNTPVTPYAPTEGRQLETPLGLGPTSGVGDMPDGTDLAAMNRAAALGQGMMPSES